MFPKIICAILSIANIVAEKMDNVFFIAQGLPQPT
jgi:hypothetical protein